MSRKMNMCLINRDFVDDIARLAGSQAQIMTRAGISWNTWNKIAAGQPIRLTVGERLKARVIEDLRNSADNDDEVQPAETKIEALERDFLECVVMTPGQAAD